MTVTVSNKPSLHSDGKACDKVVDDLVVLSFHDSVVNVVVVVSCNSSGNMPRKYGFSTMCETITQRLTLRKLTDIQYYIKTATSHCLYFTVLTFIVNLRMTSFY